MPISKDNFQVSVEDAGESAILTKYLSPQAHFSVGFFPPASKCAFPRHSHSLPFLFQASSNP